MVLFRERAGLTEEQVAGTCAADPQTSAFPSRERQLVHEPQQLHDTAQVTERLWQELRAEWTDEQLVELVMFVGRYHLNSFVTNAFRLPRESYAASFRRK